MNTESGAEKRKLSAEEEHFLKTVEQVCARSGLYLGRDDFFAVKAYFEGYIRGLIEAGQLKTYPFGNLLPLMVHQHGFSNPGWGWWRHYLHDKITDVQAIKDFPRFLREAMEVPDSRIQELDANRPANHKAPDSPQTQKYD